MGIVAKYWGNYGNFKDNISARHEDNDINKVEHSIRFLPNDPDAPVTKVSKLLDDGKGDISQRLDK